MRLQKLVMVTAIVAGVAACKKNVDPVIIIPPSTGSDKVVFNGLAANETGSAAGNSVYLDLSTNKTSAVLRSGWDLGFYSGSDFRVILNNTTSAGAKVTAKYNLADVGVADTTGLTLSVNQANPLSTDLAYFDDIEGELSKTVIPSVSATDTQNPVIIINRGTGGATPARPWVKMRVLRNGTSGYTLQYAGITETIFKTISVSKDADYNFTFASFDNGVVSAEPEKTKWDLVWSYSVFQTNFGAGMVPYNFSDLIAVNSLANVQVAQKVYADATSANNAFVAFNKDSVSKSTLLTGRWTIGSNWRSTQPATGAKQDRFYIIKDANGNFYKLKCLSMGVGTDGGTRGKPEFKYALIKQ